MAWVISGLSVLSVTSEWKDVVTHWSDSLTSQTFSVQGNAKARSDKIWKRAKIPH